MSRPRQHLVLITYGEPPEPSFGAQLRYSWRILLGLTRAVAPIPLAVLPIIALKRAWSRVSLWRAERYRSPLEPITRDQAEGIAAALQERDPEVEWRVHVAYEFRDPLLPHTLDRLPADEPVLVLPMYVADSAFTHEISRGAVVAWVRDRPQRARSVSVVPSLPAERFADIAARHVMRECERLGVGGHDWALILAAHGTLLAPQRPIETGRVATEAVAQAISDRCATRFGYIQLGWLNHVYGGRWTQPPADEALRRAVEAGFRRVVYFPFGFSADNAESQLEGRIVLRTRSDLEAHHLPCLNATPEYLDALADGVIEARDARRRTAVPASPPAPTRHAPLEVGH
jgi:protoheme ferro-lyase